MRAAVYVRQSLDKSGAGLAVARQREDCERLCERRGWPVERLYVENDTSASGRKPRPKFEAMLADARAGRFDVIVGWHLDRLTRTLRDLMPLLELAKEHNVGTTTVSGDLDLTTDQGRTVAGLLAVVAQGEIDRKTTRQTRAGLQAAEQGRRVGGRRPFGYDQDGMTIRDHEAQAVRDGFDALLAGVPLAAIARDWNRRGLTSGQMRWKGKRDEAGRLVEPSSWRADSVRHVLGNPRYAGLRAHRGEIIGAAVWPALVAEATWRAAGAVLSDPARLNAPGTARALLTGVAECGVCGATVHGGRTRGGNRIYRCSATYGHVGRRAAPVDAYVADLAGARLSRADAADLLIDHDRADLDALRTEALALRASLDDLAALVADGTLTRVSAQRESRKLRESLSDVEAVMADAGRVNLLGPVVNADDVARAWQGLDVSRQRAIIDALMSVRLLPPGRGTRIFRPDSVAVEWRQTL